MAYKKFAALVSAAALSGCATYSDWVGHMETEISRGQPDKALQVLERHAQSPAVGINASGRDAVLFLLNRAMLLRMAGDFESSNASFEAAKAMIAQLSATSVTEQGRALTINEMMRSYTGDYFEQVLIHVFEALNYLELNQPDQARVEALQLDVKLNAHEADYEDGFPRYLTGMIYEGLGEWDDAMIAYRKAYVAYQRYPEAFHMPVPSRLKADLIRLADKVGLKDEAKRYREIFGKATAVNSPADGGELVFVLNTGLAPIKRSHAVATATASGKLVTVALPYYEARRPTVTAARLSAADDNVSTDLVEDVSALAIDALAKQQPALLARAISRAVIKTRASKEADKSNNAAGLLVNLAGVISERADTRSWSTLPNRIYLARLPLAAGRHEVEVELLDRVGNVVNTRRYVVEIDARAKRYISLSWVMADDLLATHPVRER